MKCLPTNITALEDPCSIFVLTKETKITRGPTINVSNPPPGFMIQMDFLFFNVESIRGFTSTFVDIYSANSYPFGFESTSKRPPLGILKILVTILRDKYKKFSFIQLDEYGALARSSGFIRTCHNMNIIVQTTGGDASSINGKCESQRRNFIIPQDLFY